MRETRFDEINELLLSETLPNGLHINIIPKPEYSSAFAMFATNYGSADRRFKLSGQWLDTPAGVAHYLEHKLFDMPDGNALSVLSANGASPNAFTSTGMTAYYFESTTGFEDNLRTLLTFVSTPYFTAESVQKEQGIIGQEIRMTEDDPDHALYNNLLKCLYAHNPIKECIAGTVESIAEITDKTLYHCHSVFYNPSNMNLSVVGNIDPDVVVKTAKALLPDSGGEIPERDYGEAEGALPCQGSISAKMAVSAPQFLFGGKVAPAPEGEARLRQLLVGKIALRLLFGRSSRLYNSLYEQGVLNGRFEYELDYTAGTAMFLCGGESSDVEAVKKAYEDEISAVAKNGVDEALFQNNRRAVFGSELRALGSFSSMAQQLCQGSFERYCPLDGFRILSTITASEVSGFIAECITPERTALSVVEPV